MDGVLVGVELGLEKLILPIIIRLVDRLVALIEIDDLGCCVIYFLDNKLVSPSVFGIFKTFKNEIFFFGEAKFRSTKIPHICIEKKTPKFSSKKL